MDTTLATKKLFHAIVVIGMTDGCRLLRTADPRWTHRRRTTVQLERQRRRQRRHVVADTGGGTDASGDGFRRLAWLLSRGGIAPTRRQESLADVRDDVIDALAPEHRQQLASVWQNRAGLELQVGIGLRGDRR